MKPSLRKYTLASRRKRQKREKSIEKLVKPNQSRKKSSETARTLSKKKMMPPQPPQKRRTSPINSFREERLETFENVLEQAGLVENEYFTLLTKYKDLKSSNSRAIQEKNLEIEERDLRIKQLTIEISKLKENNRNMRNLLDLTKKKDQFHREDSSKYEIDKLRAFHSSQINDLRAEMVTMKERYDQELEKERLEFSLYRKKQAEKEKTSRDIAFNNSTLRGKLTSKADTATTEKNTGFYTFSPNKKTTPYEEMMESVFQEHQTLKEKNNNLETKLDRVEQLLLTLSGGGGIISSRLKDEDHSKNTAKHISSLQQPSNVIIEDRFARSDRTSTFEQAPFDEQDKDDEYDQSNGDEEEYEEIEEDQDSQSGQEDQLSQASHLSERYQQVVYEIEKMRNEMESLHYENESLKEMIGEDYSKYSEED